MPDWKCSILIKKWLAKWNVFWYYRLLVLDNGISFLRTKIKLDKIFLSDCKFLRHHIFIYLYVLLYKFYPLFMVLKYSLILLSVLVVHTTIWLNDILILWIMALNMKEDRVAFWKAIISKYSLYLSAGVKTSCYGELNFLKMPVSRG